MVKKVVALLLILSYSSLLFAESNGQDSSAVSVESVTNIVSESSVAPLDSSNAPVVAAPVISKVESEQVAYNACVMSEIAGRGDAAGKHSTVGWGVFGIASGFLFGLLGIGASTLISAIPKPKPEVVPDPVQVPSLECYTEAYTSKAKSKNIMTTLGMSCLGWVIWIPIAVSISK